MEWASSTRSGAVEKFVPSLEYLSKVRASLQNSERAKERCSRSFSGMFQSLEGVQLSANCVKALRHFLSIC